MLKGPVKCACGREGCELAVWTDPVAPGLWVRDTQGNETLIYLDPNGIVHLIQELGFLLFQLTNKFEAEN